MLAKFLTTFDNKFSPIYEFEKWKNFDDSMNYNTCQLLARISKNSDVLSIEEITNENNLAIDSIIEMQPEFYRFEAVEI